MTFEKERLKLFLEFLILARLVTLLHASGGPNFESYTSGPAFDSFNKSYIVHVLRDIWENLFSKS